MVRLGRRRRLIVSTVLTGAPGARDQHFIGHAYVVLERERQDSVRRAVLAVLEEARGPASVALPEDRALVDSVRDIAGYIAQRLMNERMGALSDLARAGQLQSVRTTFDDAVIRLADTREAITAAALALAPRRIRGENVSRDIAAAVNTLLSAERFDLMIAPHLPMGATALGHTAEAGAMLRGALPTRTALRAAGTSGLTRLERAAAWLLEMTRLVVDSLTREHAGWATGSRVADEAAVGTMRFRIQRYARDIGLNVAILVGMLLLFVLAIAL